MCWFTEWIAPNHSCGSEFQVLGSAVPVLVPEFTNGELGTGTQNEEP